MSRFTDEQISQWVQTYEREICAKHNLIADRWSLEIFSGLSEYELPNYVTNIRSVLFQGKELHPKGFRTSVITNDTPFQTAGSIPYEYNFSGRGLRVLKLYPTPMIDIPVYIPAFPDLDLWTPQADEAAVIIEFYRTPNYTSTDGQGVLPAWLRRYLLKDYVCFKGFSTEGPQQDLRAAAYYEGRMSEGEGYIKKIKVNMNQAVQHILYTEKANPQRGPGRPVLPPNFGFPVVY